MFIEAKECRKYANYPKSSLKFSPLVGTLAVGESKRVEILFSPPIISRDKTKEQEQQVNEGNNDDNGCPDDVPQACLFSDSCWMGRCVSP